MRPFFLSRPRRPAIPDGPLRTSRWATSPPCRSPGLPPGPRALLSAAVLGVLLVGCASRTVEPPPPLDLETPFSASGEAEAPDRWWRALEDPELNTLIDRALQSNLGLKGAWERLRAARAVVDRESAALFPSLDGTAEASTESGLDNRETFRGRDRARAALTATYEVDLWGRIRAGVAAERHRVRATRADYRAAALSLVAEVSRIWYRLVEARSRHDLLGEQMATNRKALALIRARFNTGQVRRADVLRQRQLLESVREQRLAAESRIGALEHQLALLLGRPPQEGIDYSAGGLPPLPPVPETGLPAELVRRRPDVRSAYHRLRAADQEVAVAVSSQFPRLSLSASAFSEGQTAADLYDDWVLSFAANLVAPLIDAGRRDAEVERTRAVERQRLYEYGQAILTAFREVEDALVQERKQRQRVASLRRQVRLAAESYQHLRHQYLNGVTGYLDVLTALSDRQDLRRQLLAAQRDLVEFRIGLYRALAGGFRTGREGRSSGEAAARQAR